jgi:NADH-quinone oxidoreductase subunit M
MMELHILLWLPLFSAIIAYLAGRFGSPSYSKFIAVAVTLIETILAFIIWFRVDNLTDPFSTDDAMTWFKIGDLEITYHIGIDALSLPLLLLSMVVFLASVFSSFYIKEKEEVYYSLFLFLITGLVGTFIALDLFLFYIFWEIVLVPMFFMIAIWGGENRYYAAFKFFIYTHLASLVMLIGFILMYVYGADPETGVRTFNMIQLKANFAAGAATNPQIMLIFFLVFVGFVTKFPQVPVHTWLPDAHVQAPSPGSAILAGLLLKMGGYGLMRVGFWLFMDTDFFTTEEGVMARYVLLWVAVISMFYPALIALRQNDLKRMIAYSSITHMGVVLLGLAAYNEIGFMGALFMMIAHGVISPALFLLAGVIEHNTKSHTRDIDKVGGLGHKMPFATALFVFMGFASLGLPGLAGFVAEFLAFAAIFSSDLFDSIWGMILAYIAVLSIIITAGYYLWAMQRILFGKPTDELENTKPAKWWETAPVFFLGIFTLLLGVFPFIILDAVQEWAVVLF